MRQARGAPRRRALTGLRGHVGDWRQRFLKMRRPSTPPRVENDGADDQHERRTRRPPDGAARISADRTRGTRAACCRFSMMRSITARSIGADQDADRNRQEQIDERADEAGEQAASAPSPGVIGVGWFCCSR